MAIKHYATRTKSASGATQWVRVNPKKFPFEVHVLVNLSGGANLTYTVEFAIEDMVDEDDTSVTAYNLPELISQTTTQSRAVIAPVTAIRLNVTSYTSGTATLRVRQGGVTNDD